MNKQVKRQQRNLRYMELALRQIKTRILVESLSKIKLHA